MIETIIVLCIISILLDINLMIDLRGILFSFLLAKRNRKSANSMHKAQSFGDKLTFKYVGKHTAYVKDFKFYYRVHFLFLIIFPIMYILSAVFSVISLKIGTILLGAFSAIKLCLSIYLKFQQNSNRVFKYDKKYK